jgi:hypothetical protein
MWKVYGSKKPDADSCDFAEILRALAIFMKFPYISSIRPKAMADFAIRQGVH